MIEPEQKNRWLREFNLNGFILLRAFLPPDLVSGMHDQLLPILRAEHRKARDDGFARGRAPGRLALDVSEYIRLLGGPLADERFHRNPLIEELVDEVLGGANGWKRGWTQVEVVFRGSDHMAWHSDQKPEETPDLHGPHRVLRVTYNIPLVDFTWANGALEVLPGSHHLPRADTVSAAMTEIPNLYPVPLYLRRGDALLRDGNTLHRGTPNVTDAARPMLDQTYKRR
ncbi:MAG TPA: phytanoyl-CoA dioxygenase family protein [Candidatus Polarisedimenticolia bacterium]|nr:phytanoyl-CoA dioxygenase family protein [Candidatus Polarisedimenticolia bacterium]